jgi:large subunit ribosomal protein L13
LKTYMAKETDIERRWLVIDATGMPLGRLASRIALILRGKHKPEFTPHVDCGDFVVVVNADKVTLSGKKATDKILYWHTGYPGGLKQQTYGSLMASNPEKAIMLAVRRMLPKNCLGRKMIKKLKVYAGPEHPHAAQKPVPFDLKDLGK